MTAERENEPLVAAADAAEHQSSRGADGDVKTSKVFEYRPPAYFDAQSSRVPQWLQSAIANTFNFVVIHYNLWLVPFLVLFYYLYQNGHGIFIVAMVALYIPRFLDGSERTANGRPWELLWSTHLWRLSTNFLGLTIVREQELDATKRYIFGFHPHGILVFSRLATFGGGWTTVFPNIAARLLGATAVFYVPLAREICLWLKAVDASRSTAEKVLKSGKSILVYPGGVPEIFLTEPESKENKIMLKKRLGFVKLAIRHGAELVPVFVFGEKWFYNVWNPPKNVVAFFRKTLKIPIILFWGRFLWMPKKLPKEKAFGIVYGKPIPTTLNADPSDEDVQAVHAQYVAEIERIFEQYKGRFGYDADETLVIL
jgi:1-acyl-sn-glycerol-3-phosphate acyltransferase